MGYPNLVLEERVNGMNVNLIGVSHTRDFFYEHEDFFREQIVNAPAVFIEDGLKNDFYKEIANVAQESDKSLYIAEPVHLSSLLMDMAQLTIGGYLLASYLRKPKEMSRKKFLKKGVKTLLGSYLTLGSFGPRSLVQEAIGNENVVIDDALQYGTVQDYRNIVAAENLDRLSKRVQLEGDIPYFIGSDHVEGIHAYINNPKLRGKRIVYLPQDLISDTSLRKYEFQDGNWKLNEKI